MIQCPECGEKAADGAKFCDRCGRALDQTKAAPPSTPRLAALEPGTSLSQGFEIVALIGQTSIENRYRARRTRDDKVETLILRERLAPAHQFDRDEILEEPVQVAAAPTAPAEDPNGPRAKTAELKPSASMRSSASASAEGATVELTEPVEESAPSSSASQSATTNGSAEKGEQSLQPDLDSERETTEVHDLGEVFGRVLALSMTLTHPAFQRALEGFAENGRVYLAYPDEELTPIQRPNVSLDEPEAIVASIQLCQAISFAHKRGLRLNDICPQSVGRGADGRVKIASLEYVSNDNERQAEPIFNDGYTAPEIYRDKKVDKRADVFSAGALLYSWVTGERIEVESWREEAGAIRFYPPHVVSPELEQAIRHALLFDSKDRWATIDDFKTELTRLLADVRIRAAVLTDVGMVREHNEDSVMAVEYTRDSMVEPARSYLYAVCDGMGGAEAGETASAIAIGAIRSYVQDRSGRNGDAAALMTAALEEANLKILEYVSSHPESRGMGSTGVAALLEPPNAAVAWVGDSRAYMFESGALRQITKDHSLVQRLVEIGQITADEAKHHEHKNVITRSLGARQSGPAGAEAVSVRLKRGDKLVLCSDGLTAHVDDPAIADILRRHPDPHDAARELICAANAGGGTDNISVAVVYAS